MCLRHGCLALLGYRPLGCAIPHATSLVSDSTWLQQKQTHLNACSVLRLKPEPDAQAIDELGPALEGTLLPSNLLSLFSSGRRLPVRVENSFLILGGNHDASNDRQSPLFPELEVGLEG